MNTAPSRLERTLAQIPDAPGVYQMIGKDDRILYIGKAVSLRSRVRSYFQDSAAHAYRTVKMVERVLDVRTIVVTNEIEALILEANLIKRHQPLFNVRMRDDKSFPYLKVTNEHFPRVTFTRTLRDDGARYFGPYTNAHGLRELIDLVRIVFPLRTCREPIDGKRSRPCLQYHIKRCMAPCVSYQSETEYDEIVDEVVLFLEGRQEALLARLDHEMRAYALNLNYEAAARVRDRITAVRRVTEKQKVVWRSRVDMDLIAAAHAQGQSCMQVFMVRSGKLIGQEHFILEGTHDQPQDVLFAEFLKQFYTTRSMQTSLVPAGSPSAVRVALSNEVPVPLSQRAKLNSGSAVVPKEILIERLPAEAGVIAHWLSETKEQRVRIIRPERGPRAEYLRLVAQNAEQNLKAFLVQQETQETASARSLTELATALDLPDVPHRVECYDISNIQGTNPVASMVVFSEGRAKKNDYRHFAIKYDQGPNDFAMMQETLRRRLKYLLPDADPKRAGRFAERPDLLLIDGGKGQLSAVVEVMQEMGFSGIPVAGLAKEHEWLYVPGQSEPIILPPNSPALHLVMRIRDEAHRFAVEYHRKRRGKSMTRSALDTLEGVGPVRKKRLLTRFGSLAAIKRASVDEIAAVKGMNPGIASRVKAALGA